MGAQSSSEGRAQVEKLVSTFEKNRAYYRSKEFSESATRSTLIDPFWSALGWDVSDSEGLGPYRDVIVEQAIKSAPTAAGEEDWDGDLSDEELAERVIHSTFPDYVFRTEGEPRFVCEAKRPAVSLRAKGPTFQAKSYGYTMEGVTLAVLTDFEEFRVFDARYRPELSLPSAGIVPGLDLKYTHYLDRWDRIWALLSREAVAGGSLEVYTRKQPAKGSTPVSVAFLAELAGWRKRIAEDLIQRNANLTRWELAEATQRILDRVVFIRTMEDRGVLAQLALRPFARTTDSFQKMRPEFRRLDAIYNGQLFAPHFLEDLDLSDSVMQPLIASLYPPQSPFRFDAISSDLLGRIYEQFLGEEITVDGDSVSIQEKPEVRHSGGVYYTPRWIVDRIVSSILGPLVEGKTPKAVANLRVVDPACGSGAFLLGAFDFLVTWHERYYSDHPHETPERHYVADSGDRRLTADEKGRIVANNLFGCDIDPQAVEVTQMSLYIAILQGESLGSLTKQQRMFHSTYLPRLDKNIRCGNSLLGYSTVQDGQLLQDPDLIRRINPFDWDDPKAGFGEVFTKRRGFDAVIGNPPYTRTQVLQKYRPEETALCAAEYETGQEGSFDLASLFVEQGLRLLRPDGRLGFIITRQFAETDAGRPLREILAKGRHVSSIVDFNHGFVFYRTGPGTKPVSAYTMLLLLSNKPTGEWQLTRVPPPPTAIATRAAEAPSSPRTATISHAVLGAGPWDLLFPVEQELLDRMAHAHPSLSEVAGGVIFQGVPTGADYVFWVNNGGPLDGDPTLHRVTSRPRGSRPVQEGLIEAELLRPVWAGSADLTRFHANASASSLIVPYDTSPPSSAGKAYALVDGDRMRSSYPHAWDWLEANKPELLGRSKPQKNKSWTDDNYWGYSRPQNLERFDRPKIWVPYMISHLCATYDAGNHAMVNVTTGGYGIPEETLSEDAPWVTALLNSHLLSWALHCYSRAFAGDWFAARKGTLGRLPIACPDKDTRDQIIALYQACVKARAGEDAEELAVATEAFDRAVYDLYEVTHAERLFVREGL
jgi:type I restriction-modification system DNA methylase subunit